MLRTKPGVRTEREVYTGIFVPNLAGEYNSSYITYSDGYSDSCGAGNEWQLSIFSRNNQVLFKGSVHKIPIKIAYCTDMGPGPQHIYKKISNNISGYPN